MAKESEDAPDRDDAGDDSEDECDRIQTIEESSMPLEEILTRFVRLQIYPVFCEHKWHLPSQ